MASTALFKDLDTLPRQNQTHQWADYIELLAITSEDQLFSQGQLQEVEGEIEDLAVEMDDVDSDQETALNTASDSDEKLNRRWADIKVCLHSRYNRFGNAWPFELKDDVLYAKVNGDNILHRLYIALLLASALRYISTTRRKEITSSLEEIGYQVFRKLMPASQQNGETAWIVKPFGAHQQIAEAYEGKLFDKLTKLANDLNATLVAKEDEFNQANSGDGGLDLVAWHPMGDGLGHIPVAFAQCGCSLDDLSHKQFEANAVNFDTKVLIHHPPACYYFAPHDLRKNSGHWDAHLGRIIMLDRMRILHLAKLYQLPVNNLNWPHVDEAINTRRNLIA